MQVREPACRASLREARELVALVADHHRPASESLANRDLEFPAVLIEHAGSFLIERVVRIRLEHQELQAHDDGLDREHGLPVLAQYVQAYVPLHVDVRMEDRRLAEHLGCVVRVRLRDLKVEDESATLVDALVRLDGDLEVQKVFLQRQGRNSGRRQDQRSSRRRGHLPLVKIDFDPLVELELAHICPSEQTRPGDEESNAQRPGARWAGVMETDGHELGSGWRFGRALDLSAQR